MAGAEKPKTSRLGSEMGVLRIGNNRNGPEESSCKPVEQEENDERGSCGSWATAQIGNPGSEQLDQRQ